MKSLLLMEPLSLLTGLLEENVLWCVCFTISSHLLAHSSPVFYISDSGRSFDCQVLCGQLGIPLSSCSLGKTLALSHVHVH